APPAAIARSRAKAQIDRELVVESFPPLPASAALTPRHAPDDRAQARAISPKSDPSLFLEKTRVKGGDLRYPKDMREPAVPTGAGRVRLPAEPRGLVRGHLPLPVVFRVDLQRAYAENVLPHHLHVDEACQDCGLTVQLHLQIAECERLVSRGTR